MKTFVRSILLLSTSTCLLACWAPEAFQTSLAVDKAHQYQFAYDGTIVFGPALALIQERGSLSAADEQQMSQLVTNLRKDPGIVSAEYVGRGRYRIKYRGGGTMRPGDKVFLDVLQFSSEPQRGLRIQGAEIQPSFRKNAKALGLALDGTIRLTSDAPVVAQNAQSTPWFGGLFGAYTWHVTVDQKELPTAVVR